MSNFVHVSVIIDNDGPTNGHHLEHPDKKDPILIGCVSSFDKKKWIGYNYIPPVYPALFLVWDDFFTVYVLA